MNHFMQIYHFEVFFLGINREKISLISSKELYLKKIKDYAGNKKIR